eukprot:7396179-Pyramimonas_sp.AAC.1
MSSCNMSSPRPMKTLTADRPTLPTECLPCYALAGFRHIPIPIGNPGAIRNHQFYRCTGYL